MPNFMGGPGCTPAELRRVRRYQDMTGGRNTVSPTPLQDLFGEIAVPLCTHPDSVQLRVWHNLSGWHAAWGIGSAVCGAGSTPEDAILSAHANYIAARERNALKHRVARVKREHKDLGRPTRRNKR